MPLCSRLPDGHDTYVTADVPAALSCAAAVAERTQADALGQSMGQFVRVSAGAAGQSQPDPGQQRTPGVRPALVLLPADPAKGLHP